MESTIQIHEQAALARGLVAVAAVTSVARPATAHPARNPYRLIL